MTLPKEIKFEDHFCKKLDDNGYRKRLNDDVDLEFNVDDDLLLEFLKNTQADEIKEIEEDAGKDWFKQVKKIIKQDLKKKKLFEVIREGIAIERHPLKLIYFKPETSYNKEAKKRYGSNVFSFVRQFAFRNTRESIDVVLFLNGLAIITIELKSPFNGQVVDDAVAQYINDRDKSLDIFNKPFLHIATDTKKAKITTEFIRNNVEDFVWFNKDLENPEVNEFGVEYLYNEILLPSSLIEIIEHYLYCFDLRLPNKTKIRTYFFPRYHQRRTVKNLVNDITKKYKKNKKLDLKYLIQHSAGSGKSFTIAVMQKFLRYLHIDNENIFDSVIIITDRINLDGQLKGTIGATEKQKKMIAFVEKTTELAKALNENTKVIITTIQKFSVKNLNEVLDKQKNKKLCFLIDEIHRSQTGKLHKNMVGHFEPDEEDVQAELIENFSKKKFPNFVFIGLTATPSDKILSMFGEPFDVYSMDQAEKEGYILNVSDNIITYETLYELSTSIGNGDEYPPLIVSKKLKNKAYEDENIISQKIDIILKIFENQTKYAIKNNYSKAMIVTCSRKSAVKYKLLIDEALKKRGLKEKTLVAFTGSIEHTWKGKKEKFTENNMNKIHRDIEEEFKKPEYRYLIVANKFQTGFNEPLLHTMFLDKSVQGINAVQTISRLNRIFPNKTNTLVVDFTNSYKKIIKAFQKFKKDVKDFYCIDVKELPGIYNGLLKMNVFTKQDVSDFKEISTSNAGMIKLEKLGSKIETNLKKKYGVDERRLFRSDMNKFNQTFNYLNNLIEITDEELKNFALFSFYMVKYLNPQGMSKKLDAELRKVYIKMHKIKLSEQDTMLTKESITEQKGKERKIVYATVKEVVDAINTKFNIAPTNTEKNIIREYMDEVVNDGGLKSDLVSNKGKDLKKLYKQMIVRKLNIKFVDFFIQKNPEKINEYLDTGMKEFLNSQAFNITVDKLGLA
jgi:type I restriction enzyme, R subunit